MAVPAYIPGSAVTVTVTAADTTIGPTAASCDWNYGAARLTKARLGAQAADTLAGQESGTVSLSGHMSDENFIEFVGLGSAANQPLQITLTNASGAKVEFDAVCEIGASVTGDGEMDWSLDGDISGVVTPTAAP